MPEFGTVLLNGLLYTHIWTIVAANVFFSYNWKTYWYISVPHSCIIISSHSLGWGLLSRFPPFRYFHNFSTSLKYMLAIEYHVHSWQVSAAVTPVKYEWDSKNVTSTFARSKILLTEKLTNGALVTPTPGLQPQMGIRRILRGQLLYLLRCVNLSGKHFCTQYNFKAIVVLWGRFCNCDIWQHVKLEVWPGAAILWERTRFSVPDTGMSRKGVTFYTKTGSSCNVAGLE